MSYLPVADGSFLGFTQYVLMQRHETKNSESKLDKKR